MINFSNISASNAIITTLLLPANVESKDAIVSELMLKTKDYDSKKLLSLDSYYEDRVGALINEWIVFYLRSMDIVYDAIKDETVKLFESNQKVLNLLVLNSKMSIQEMAKELEMSESGIKKIIKQLKNEGKLAREGFKGGYWIVKKEN